MTRGTAGRSATLATGVLALVWLLAGGAWAQTPTPDQQSCADFETQEDAQAYYDDHQDDNPNDPDPADLDTDGDGKACEGLPTSQAAATASPAQAGASPTPTAEGTQELPQNGAATGVMALSGLSLLELGYAMTLVSKRLGVRSRALPLHLMRRLTRAASRGEDRVEVADDLYLVHRSVLDASPIAGDPIDERAAHRPAPAGPSVYAAIARPDAVPPTDEA